MTNYIAYIPAINDDVKIEATCGAEAEEKLVAIYGGTRYFIRVA